MRRQILSLGVVVGFGRENAMQRRQTKLTNKFKSTNKKMAYENKVSFSDLKIIYSIKIIKE
jgi:hypothetical protein